MSCQEQILEKAFFPNFDESAIKTTLSEDSIIYRFKEDSLMSEEDIDDLVKATLIMDGGYKVLNKEEIESIFRKSM